MLHWQEFRLGIEEPLKTSVESSDMIKANFHDKYYDSRI